MRAKRMKESCSILGPFAPVCSPPVCTDASRIDEFLKTHLPSKGDPKFNNSHFGLEFKTPGSG